MGYGYGSGSDLPGPAGYFQKGVNFFGRGGDRRLRAMFRQALHCRQAHWISETALGALISTYWPQEAISRAESG